MRRNKANIAIAIRRICLVGALALEACSAEKPEPPLLPDVMYTNDARTVRAVQSALRQRHYYTAEVDGFFGQATGDAIQRFEMDHGLRVKPVISRSLLTALGMANNPRSYQ